MHQTLSIQNTVTSPTPSARRPLSSLPRETYSPEPVRIQEMHYSQDIPDLIMFDETDNVPLSQFKMETMIISDDDAPIEPTPVVKQRQPRKKKSTTVTKRSTSVGRKTRKQTALENDNNLVI